MVSVLAYEHFFLCVLSRIMWLLDGTVPQNSAAPFHPRHANNKSFLFRLSCKNDLKEKEN
jgi:hypothetical protein